jgi:hypothetical protein
MNAFTSHKNGELSFSVEILAEHMSGVEASPILAQYFTALSNLNQAITDILESSKVEWYPFDDNHSEDADQNRHIVINIDERKIYLYQERRESGQELLTSSLTVSANRPDGSSDEIYQMFIFPRNLPDSSVHYYLKPNPWMVSDSELITRPDTVQKATAALQHFAQLVKVLKEVSSS